MSAIIKSEQLKYIESFRKSGNELLTEMEQYAEENNIPILSWQSAQFMEQIVLMLKPERVLEIGTAIGYTTIRIAGCLSGNAEIHTIELSEDNIKTAEHNFPKSGVAEKIKLLKGNALEIMPQLSQLYDLIFLDADKEDYIKLFRYSLPLLKKGGAMVVDNMLWHGYAASENIPSNYKESTRHIKTFNQLFMNNEDLITSLLPVGDGLGIGIKK